MFDDNPPREVEAKYNADAAAREALLHLPTIGGFSLVRAARKHQEDLYFDTADAALKRAGVTLRVRRVSGGALMTYKADAIHAPDGAEAHLASRVEDEAILEQGLAARVQLDAPLPPEIDISPVRRARRISADRALLPVARLENERVTLDMRDETGAEIEIAVDHVRGTRLSDGRHIEFDEVELESKSGGREALLRLARALEAQVPGLRPSRETKLGRTLG